MGACNCSIFDYKLFYVHSSFAIIFMGKRELVALLSLSFWCLVTNAVPWICLQFVIVVFPNHTHVLFFQPKVHILGLSILNFSNELICILHNTKGIVLKFSQMI